MVAAGSRDLVIEWEAILSYGRRFREFENLQRIRADEDTVQVPLGALNARDYTLLQGLMIVFAICVIVVNTLTDLTYGLVDPRVKYT